MPARKGATGAGTEKSHGEACLHRCAHPTGSDTDTATYRANLTALAGYFAQGVDLDYGAAFAGEAHLRVPLPTYPFAGESHWAGPPPLSPLPVTTLSRPVPDHPLIHRSSVVEGAPGTLRASTVFKGDEAVLRDHTVRGQRVLPGAAHLEMAREAAARVWGTGAKTPLLIRDMTWVRPVAFDGAPLSVDVLVRPAEGEELTFEIASKTGRDTAPVVFSTGRIAPSGTTRPDRVDLASLRARCVTAVSAERVRAALAAMGIVHGPSLRAVREAHVGTGTVLARLDLPAETDPAEAGYVLPPALLDSAIQSSIALQLADGGASVETVVPFALDRFELFAPCTASMWAVVRVADGAEPATALSRLDVDLVDGDGEVCVRMTGYTSRRAKETAPALFAPVWEPVSERTSGAAALPPTEQVLVVGGSSGQRSALARQYPRAMMWDLAPGASTDEITSRLRDLTPVGHLLWIAPGAAPEDQGRSCRPTPPASPRPRRTASSRPSA